MSDIFKQYPNMEVYFETSDGTKFYKEETAKTYGRTLADKSVKTVTKTVSSELSLLTKFDEIIALAPQMEEATAKLYLEAEKKRPSVRKSVVDALETRLKAFEEPANVNTNALIQNEAEILALVPNMDAETAKGYLNAEHLSDPQRANVIDALNARITELEKLQD